MCKKIVYLYRSKSFYNDKNFMKALECNETPSKYFINIKKYLYSEENYSFEITLNVVYDRNGINDEFEFMFNNKYIKREEIITRVNRECITKSKKHIIKSRKVTFINHAFINDNFFNKKSKSIIIFCDKKMVYLLFNFFVKIGEESGYEISAKILKLIKMVYDC